MNSIRTFIVIFSIPILILSIFFAIFDKQYLLRSFWDGMYIGYSFTYISWYIVDYCDYKIKNLSGD